MINLEGPKKQQMCDLRIIITVPGHTNGQSKEGGNFVTPSSIKFNIAE